MRQGRHAFPTLQDARIWLREQLETDSLLCRRLNFPGPNPRCRSDQTLRSSQARFDPGFREFYSQIGSAALHALSAAFGSHAALGVNWVEEDSRFASARSGLPRTHGERASGLQGPIAPSAGHEVSPVADCLLPFMVRPRAPSERPWRCGRPSFPTARRDSLSSRSDNFP